MPVRPLAAPNLCQSIGSFEKSTGAKRVIVFFYHSKC